MPLPALLLALAAAVLHAFWNLVLARAKDAEAAAAVVFGLAVVLYAPVAGVAWEVEREAIPYLAGSAALELAYLVLLATAYRRVELSVVYPVARGAAPVLVLVLGAVALGAATTPLEIAGVILVALGVLFVRGFRRDADWRGVVYGLVIAVCIAGYTLIDARGIEHANPLAYLELVMAIPVLAYVAAIGAVKGWQPLREELTFPAVLAAAATFGAFALALFALRLATAASVAAVRETSVVIAVALAAPVLRERVGWTRLAGAALVVAGVALVSLG